MSYKIRWNHKLRKASNKYPITDTNSIPLVLQKVLMYKSNTDKMICKTKSVFNKIVWINCCNTIYSTAKYYNFLQLTYTFWFAKYEFQSKSRFLWADKVRDRQTISQTDERTRLMVLDSIRVFFFNQKTKTLRKTTHEKKLNYLFVEVVAQHSSLRYLIYILTFLVHKLTTL